MVNSKFPKVLLTYCEFPFLIYLGSPLNAMWLLLLLEIHLQGMKLRQNR